MEHEAFTRLWLKWDTLYQSKLIHNKVWLIRAVKNILREDYRETQCAGAEGISEKADYIERENNINGKTEELQYEYYLKEIINELKPNEREIFKLIEQGESYAEISKQLQMKEVTIRSIISRMRARLKETVSNLLEK